MPMTMTAMTSRSMKARWLIGSPFTRLSLAAPNGGTFFWLRRCLANELE